MSRTKGAKDLKKRKPRSDRKHKYVKRKGKLVPYISKRKRGDRIKIWFWEIREMSKEGYLRWNKKIRAKISRRVYKPYLRVDVYPDDISNGNSIAETALQSIGHEGDFLMMGFSHGKNKYRVKPVKLCRVTILSTRSSELKVVVKDTFRLSRYWFWRGN